MQIIEWVLSSWMNICVCVVGGSVILFMSKEFLGKLNQKFFAWQYNMTGRIVDNGLRSIKVELFGRLGEMLQTHKKDGQPFRILDVGTGAGVNFQYYPAGCEVTCVDPNPYFGPYLEQLRHKHPGIKFGDLIVAGAEDMSQIKDNLFDACVLSVVLCSAGDPTQCLQEMKRVLKPGGKLLYVEHVAAPEDTWTNTFQGLSLISWPWRQFFDGCCLQRNTGDVIMKAGFSDVDMKHSWQPFPLPARVIAYVAHGVATK